jgi:uncharacterized protein YqgC (DUF456 family)
MTVLLWVLAIVLVAVGLVGVVVPALPGTILVFAGLLLAAWADDFSGVGVWTIVVIGVIAAASYTVDFVAAALGAKRLGASKRAMTGAALGTLLGLFFGLPGLIIGPFVGAVLGELSTNRDLKQAGRAGLAAWIGFAVGIAVKVGLVFVMIGIFLAALFL